MVIKTTVAGAGHGDVDAHVHATRDLIDALESAPGARRQPLKLQMAKADLRSERTP